MFNFAARYGEVPPTSGRSVRASDKVQVLLIKYFGEVPPASSRSIRASDSYPPDERADGRLSSFDKIFGEVAQLVRASDS